MMRRIGLLALAGLIGVLFSTAAQAQWLEEFCDHVAKTTMRVNCWPKPHIYADREAVRTPIAIMVANGRVRQNTLSEYYFAPGGTLTESGRRKVRWILTQSAFVDRTIFVYQSPDSIETAAQIASVREEIKRIQPENKDPRVVVTNVRPVGWPAERVGRIGAKFNESLPTPTLPASSGDQME
jgi:hypothetical protein